MTKNQCLHGDVAAAERRGAMVLEMGLLQVRARRVPVQGHDEAVFEVPASGPQRHTARKEAGRRRLAGSTSRRRSWCQSSVVRETVGGPWLDSTASCPCMTVVSGEVRQHDTVEVTKAEFTGAKTVMPCLVLLAMESKKV